MTASLLAASTDKKPKAQEEASGAMQRGGLDRGLRAKPAFQPGATAVPRKRSSMTSSLLAEPSDEKPKAQEEVSGAEGRINEFALSHARALSRPTTAMRGLGLTAALCLLSPSPALADLPSWWRVGAFWAGDGVQDDGQRWTVEIVLNATDARINYPSVPCGGTLQVLSATPTTVTLRETITSGTDLCITGGTLVLRVEAGGSLLYDWTDPATGFAAKAILAPPGS